jgi:hypothetical protein
LAPGGGSICRWPVYLPMSGLHITTRCGLICKAVDMAAADVAAE